jgi:hypothetical protein
MATPSGDVVLICYQWGFAGWMLVMLALSWGRGLWTGATWYACRAGQLHVVMMAATGLASMALQYTVATLLLRGDTPYPACNNNPRAFPDMAVWLLYHYWTLAAAHELYSGRVSWSWLRAARRVAELLGVPVVLIYTGNTTWAYAAAGAGFGTAMGLLSAVLLLVLWAPRMAAVAPFLARLGIVHDPRQDDIVWVFF